MDKETVKRTGITFTIEDGTRRKFRSKLIERGENMAAVLRKWVENYVVRDAP